MNSEPLGCTHKVEPGEPCFQCELRAARLAIAIGLFHKWAGSSHHDELAGTPMATLLDEVVRRLQLDGIDPDSLTIGEIRRA
jgi:hypothetical protein